MNDHELGVIFARVRSIADELATEPRGIVTMRHNMRQSQAGARSSSLDTDRGGDRYETVLWNGVEHRVRIPANDPTGEAAMGEDEPGKALEEMEKLARRIDADMIRLRQLRYEWAPKHGAVKPVEGEQGPGNDWCGSCWRDNKTCEPATERYKARCRWCGDWRAEHGDDPPLPLVRARHRGERITSALVAQYVRKKAG